MIKCRFFVQLIVDSSLVLFSLVDIKKKKDNFLDFLEKHKLIKWLFFLAAFIGAVATILKVPVGIYEYTESFFQNSHQEQTKIDEVDIGVSMDYIYTIFGEPNYKKLCNSTGESTMESQCHLKDIAENRYTYEFDDYYIQFLADVDETVVGYTIFLRDMDFNPKIELFMGRFVGEEEIVLGKTKFAELSVPEDGFLLGVREQIVGNNFSGYYKILYSEDYAVDYFIILEATYPAEWSGLYTETGCDYSLLNMYTTDGNFTILDEDIRAINLDEFANSCPIQTITILDTQGVQSLYGLEEQEKEAALREEIQFFAVP